MANIFLIHSLKLRQRIPPFLDQFSKLKWVKSITIVTIEEDTSLKFADPFSNIAYCSLFEFHPRLLTMPEKSVFKKHYYALKQIALSPLSDSHSYVFEDDVNVRTNELELLNNNLKQDAYKAIDLIYFGTGPHIPIHGITFRGLFSPDHTIHKSMCADSTIVSSRAARLIIDDYAKYPPYMPFDYDMSLRIHRLNLVVAWYQPGITFQGSVTGRFPSSIQKG